MAAADSNISTDGIFGTPDDMIGQFFEPHGDMRTVIPIIRQMVRFERRDILREPPPPTVFEFVVCRNVIIYFDRPAQEELFAKFHHVPHAGRLPVARR